MDKARLESLGAGRFRVGGILDASTVTALLKQSHARFQGQAQVEVDLAAVTESDSAGLALLLEWLRLARAEQRYIRFLNLPTQLTALARISEVDELLTANGSANQAPQPA